MKEDLIPARARLLKELDEIDAEIDKLGLGTIAPRETTTTSTLEEMNPIERLEEATMGPKEEVKVTKRRRGRQPGYKPKKK